MTANFATDIDAFRARLAGDVLLPGDPGYDDARSVFNGHIDRHPAVIARCRRADDVAAAVAFARDEGLEIAVRGGGHSAVGHSVCDGGLMINLSEMQQVTVDPAARRARCGGGATWADVDAATAAHGLAVPGGIVGHTGIGGLTLGGGMGWLTRRAGLSCDNLVSAEVVTADGRILTASDEEHADLFWALRGGGGNFGVVTTFEYRLHQLDPLAQLGLFFWGVEDGAEALRFSQEFVNALPDHLAAMIAAMSAPPEPFVPEQYHFLPGYALFVVGWGSAEEHAQVVKPIRAALPPLFEFVTPIPHTHLQTMFDEAYRWGTLAYEKGVYLDGLNEGAIAILTEHLPEKRSPLSAVLLYLLDGAYAAVGDDDTAFAGSRAPGLQTFVLAAAQSPELLEADRAWVRSLWKALRRHARTGEYVNASPDQDGAQLRTSYGHKYERLARIKAAYDPDNVFHLNANIKPAPAPA